MKQRLAQWLLRLMGWRLEGAKPELPKYVLIAAPHTSNWDFPLMLLFAAAFDIRVTWMAKHTLFFPPMGWIMRSLGGMPIIRHRNLNVVSAMVESFRNAASLVLVVPTEGTRGRAEHWKSGFYHIAREAGVPVVPSFLDFGQRRGGFGAPIKLSGEISIDMQHFRDFYRGMRGKFPENFGPIRLKEEDGAACAAAGSAGTGR
ncbi:MAG: lysophospholipid acyltransferase family protein [Halioglobus sp.]|nr:lysophospholipid acyltransferase family protein [Halioglobus sp.]